MVGNAIRVSYFQLHLYVRYFFGQRCVLERTVLYAQVEAIGGHLLFVVRTLYITVQRQFAACLYVFKVIGVDARYEGENIFKVVAGGVEGNVHHHIVGIGHLHKALGGELQAVQLYLLCIEGVFVGLVIYIQVQVYGCLHAVEVRDVAIYKSKRINSCFGREGKRIAGKVARSAVVQVLNDRVHLALLVVVFYIAIFNAVFFQLHSKRL